jgi:hypothetical protein
MGKVRPELMCAHFVHARSVRDTDADRPSGPPQLLTSLLPSFSFPIPVPPPSRNCAPASRYCAVGLWRWSSLYCSITRYSHEREFRVQIQGHRQKRLCKSHRNPLLFSGTLEVCRDTRLSTNLCSLPPHYKTLLVCPHSPGRVDQAGEGRGRRQVCPRVIGGCRIEDAVHARARRSPKQEG